MPRLAHIAASFAIVLMAYWAYALVAVPLIEPAAEPGAPRDRRRPRGTCRREDRAEQVGGPLFPPGAWELKDPKVLTIDQVQLSDAGATRARATAGCTSSPLRSSSPPTAPKSPADAIARSIVLEAPDGADFQFDQASICRS